MCDEIAAFSTEQDTRMRVLIVDDDLDSGRVMSDIIVYQGHKVDVAATGVAALELSRHNEYQLALIDVMLPDIDGFHLAEALLPAHTQMTCILMTGHDLPDGPAQARRLGTHYLVKPLDFTELVRLLRSASR
jgi:DNA-binding response OmpR family regulator